MAEPVESYPITAAPLPGEIDELRREFVHKFQYRFAKGSDIHTIIARFAWEKAHEAKRAARENLMWSFAAPVIERADNTWRRPAELTGGLTKPSTRLFVAVHLGALTYRDRGIFRRERVYRLA
jgi:hypothetical protein